MNEDLWIGVDEDAPCECDCDWQEGEPLPECRECYDE